MHAGATQAYMNKSGLQC